MWLQHEYTIILAYEFIPPNEHSAHFLQKFNNSLFYIITCLLFLQKLLISDADPCSTSKTWRPQSVDIKYIFYRESQPC